MDDTVTNILLSGVGGQGIILASDIMGEVFLESGFDVKKSEVHGMAQRGGSVTSHVRFGRKVYSPIIKQGEVDILFSFEELEGLRWLNYVKPDGVIVLNNHKINPPAVNLGQMEYPRDIPGIIQKQFDKFYLVVFEVEEGLWIEAILRHLLPRLHEVNRNAFALGKDQIKAHSFQS